MQQSRCNGGAEAVQRFRSRFRCSRVGCRVGPCRDRRRAGVDGGAVQVQTCRGAQRRCRAHPGKDVQVLQVLQRSGAAYEEHVLHRFRGSEVQRCRDAEMQIWR